MDRVIFHCDLNCFYASVELLSHPELREVPVAVAGDPASRHGIILAKNEPAKQCGVKTAETIWQAKKKCPNLVLLPAHHKLYREYSNKVNAIYDEYTDLAESFGIDESWLDVTNTLHLFGGDAKALANAIRQRVKRELGLTLSVGVSFNKVFAKLGSDYKKPDATTVISRENWRSIVWPLPVGDLLYVGGAAQKLLGQYGVKTIGQLAACKMETLETLMGKMGTQLYEYANGLDSAPVRARLDAEPVKSVGNGTTFPADLVRWEQIRQGLAPLCDSVATRLAHLAQQLLRQRLGTGGQLADGLDAVLGQRPLGGAAGEEHRPHRQRPHDVLPALRRDDGGGVRFFQVAAQLGEHFIEGHAHAEGKARLRLHRFADAVGQGFGVAAEEVQAAGDVQPALVNAEGLYQVSKALVDLVDFFGIGLIQVVVGRQQHQHGAFLLGLPHRFRRLHAALFRGLVFGQNNAVPRLRVAAHRHGDFPQRGLVQQLHRGEEAVQVAVEYDAPAHNTPSQ